LTTTDYRVEPRIAYSPEKTPPKTPETPHFGHNPFPKAYEEGLVNQVSSLYASLMLHLNKLVHFVPGKLLDKSNFLGSSQVVFGVVHH
jgi:hypothetical protein